LVAAITSRGVADGDGNGLGLSIGIGIGIGPIVLGRDRRSKEDEIGTGTTPR